MLKVKGKNQSMVREINQRLVLELMSKSSMSCTDIAKELKLSNTAVAKILNELKDMGMVKIDDSSSEKDTSDLGRKPILYEIDRDYAMVGLVNLCANNVIVCDLAGRVLDEYNFEPLEKFDSRNLLIINDELERMMSNYSHIQAIGVCVVTFGMLDQKTGQYVFASRFEDANGVSLRDIFGGSKKLPVTIINDTRLCLIAEQNYGLLKRDTNAVLMQVDTGVSASLLINGVNYIGDHGFAGEIGLVTWQGETLEERASVQRIMNDIKSRLKSGANSVLTLETLNWKNVVREFQNGDMLCYEIVSNAIMEIAHAIKNIMHIFDTQVVICGRIVELGEKFLSVVKRNLMLKQGFSSDIRLSELGYAQSNRLGGLKFATGVALDFVLNK